MIQLRLPAAELRAGDRCRGSRALIVRGPQRGARTPAGKVELVVRYAKQRRAGTVTWGARTLIGIDRPDASDEAAELCRHSAHPDLDERGYCLACGAYTRTYGVV